MTILNSRDNKMGQTALEVKCDSCGATEDITVSTQGFQDWQVKRVYIQKALPELSVDDRELLISGTCYVCWEIMEGDDSV